MGEIICKIYECFMYILFFVIMFGFAYLCAEADANNKKGGGKDE